MRNIFLTLLLLGNIFHAQANVTPRFSDVKVQVYGTDENGDPTYPWDISSSGWGSVDVKHSVLPDGAATESTAQSIEAQLDVLLSTRAAESTQQTINGNIITIQNNQGLQKAILEDIASATSSIDDKVATADNQELQTAELIAINGHLVTLETYLDGVEGSLSSIDTTVQAFADQNHTDLLGVQARLDTGNASLASIDGKVSTAANQVTANASLSSIDGKLTTVNSNLVTIQSKQDTGNASLASIDTKVSTAANQTTLNTRIGDLTETAPATDTASSGLNGRLQRIAQNVTSNGTKLDTVNSNLVTVQGKQDSQTTQLTAINGNTDDLEARVGATSETAAADDTSTSGLNGLIKRLLQRVTTLIAFYNSNFGADSGGIRTNAQVGNSTGPANFDYGTVGAQTLRSAAQLGNATGAADFNYGTVGAQTLRSAAQIGNATGGADFGSGATSAQTVRTSANLSDGSANALTSRTYDTKRPLEIYNVQIGASNATHTRTTLTANVSVQIAAANSARKWLYIENHSGADIFVKFGTAAVINQAIEISNNTTFKMSASELYLGAINAIVGSNGRTIEVVEGF